MEDNDLDLVGISSSHRVEARITPIAEAWQPPNPKSNT